ncbi:GntR family transcriptional regulator [uncultured Ruegeria sp.]|uniref:GntR family transcriptional regulator n=1 Tax=uncultured Ruegeria sp. TaxID=259304 RepID=UPI0026246CB2|nr:GntR family transcriptional regulator [uncultured Ruegeria sp.]
MTDAQQKLYAVRSDPDEQLIVDRIYSAVVEQKLAPRTKLSEQALCETFGVGRMHVRRALLLLSSQGVVELLPNRGAFIACPSSDEAREVFDARLMIEAGIVRELTREISSAGINALLSHFKEIGEAKAMENQTEVIRYSGWFHVELAKFHNNAILTRVVRELVARSTLILTLFGTNKNSLCPHDDHASILDAIVSREPRSAEDKMRHHLFHLRNSLDLEQTQKVETHLAKVLTGRM